MATYGSDQVTITVDSDDLSEFTTSMNGVNIQVATEDATPFGTDWHEELSAVVKSAGDLTLSGPYNDAADGPKDLKGKLGTTVPVVIAYGGSNTDSGTAIVQSFAITPAPKQVTKWSATLKWTGTITSA